MHRHKQLIKLHKLEKLGHAPVLAFLVVVGLEVLRRGVGCSDGYLLGTVLSRRLRDERVFAASEDRVYTT